MRTIRSLAFATAVSTYGLRAGAEYHAEDLAFGADGARFAVRGSREERVELVLPMSGYHNVENATGVYAAARRLGRDVEDLVVIVLDRPRHKSLIEEIRAAGARIRLIGDGDLSAGISVAVVGTGVHAVMGIGGAPEGVLTAAALRCLNGEIVARLVLDKPELRERAETMGIRDPSRIYGMHDLAPGKQIIFAATGVTEGNLLRGVRFFGDGIRTQSLVMTMSSAKVRFVDTVHLEKRADVRVQFH